MSSKKKNVGVARSSRDPLHVRWHNYENSVMQSFLDLLSEESFVDVTLVCAAEEEEDTKLQTTTTTTKLKNGQLDSTKASSRRPFSIKAHKIVLSACSPLLRSLLLESPSQHPTVILPSDVGERDLRLIVQFAYTGSVDVISKEELDSLLVAAETLQVTGLGMADVVEVEGGGSCRPDSRMSSHAAKRKSSPRFRFMKSKRKGKKPVRIGDVAETLDLTSPSKQQQHRSASSSNGSQDVSFEEDDHHHRNNNSAASAVNLDHRHHRRQSRYDRHNNAEEDEVDVVSEDDDNNVPVDFTMRRHQNGAAAVNGRRSSPETNGLLNPHRQMPPTSSEVAEILFRGRGGGASFGSLHHPPTLVPRPHSLSPYFAAAAAAAAFAANGGYDFDMQPPPPLQQHPPLSPHAMMDDDEDDEGASSVASPPDSLASSTATGFAKAYTKRDMGMALDALKMKKLTLTRASELYGIPPTTLWQRANRMGISTPKRETTNKTWSEVDLNSALDALRNKEISANKAAKRYGIPSSTLYKIARKERIELAQPFNAVQTTWSQEDLNLALSSIRGGTPVQKAAAEFGIPSGTLYGRCKKVGIELSKTTAVHWSEVDMVKALDSVRAGGMSINQAAIHHNLPYSSLYGRINRLKKDQPGEWGGFNADFEAFMAAQQQHSANSADRAPSGLDFSAFPPMNYLLDNPDRRSRPQNTYRTRQAASSSSFS